MNLQKGLVGHWTMNDEDTSGGTLYDRSGYDNHAQIRGPSTDQSGNISESYMFDAASNDDVYIPVDYQEEESIGSKDIGTMSAWYKYTTDGVFFGTPNGRDRRMRIQNSSVEVGVYYGDTSQIEYVTTAQPNDGNWHHVVMTYKVPGFDIELYFDGEFIDSYSNSDAGSANNGNALTIGSYINTDHFGGEIDDVRLYNRVLSENEVSALYNMRSQKAYRI